MNNQFLRQPFGRKYFAFNIVGLLLGSSLVLVGCGSSESTSTEPVVSKIPTAAPLAAQTAAKPIMAAEQSLPKVTVYKSPTCGCCNKWVKHLEQAGFTVTTEDHKNMSPIKQKLGVPGNLGSCHTATVGGYVVEGHVPAEDVKRLLRERPAITGLAVPGMPLGSPGMEHPQPQNYNTVAFSADGRPVLFARHGPGVSADDQ